MLYLLRGCEKSREHQMALGLLAYGLKTEYGIEKLPEIARSEQGKPYFPEYPKIYFNYSHSRQGILCGLHTGEIGVDIQGRLCYKERLAQRICHTKELEALERFPDREEAMTRFWTAKESFLKYKGCGIRVDLRRINCSGCLRGRMELEGAILHSSMEETFALAVCCQGSVPEYREVKWEDLSLDGFFSCNSQIIHL